MLRYALLTGLVLTLIAVGVASVFVYHPVSLELKPQSPGVVFEAGSNAGQPDIGPGNVITVNLGPSKTSATIILHPTYRINYYRDVVRILNNDDEAMNVHLIFRSLANTLPSGSVVKIFVYQQSTLVKELDVTNPPLNQPIIVGSIPAEGEWQLDFYIWIPEGTNITGASYELTADLVYTPSSEMPPVNPSTGR